MSSISHINENIKEDLIFDPAKMNQEKAFITSFDQYEQMYKQSIEKPSEFWANIAKENFYWEQLWKDDTNVVQYNYNMDKGKVFVKWFEGAKTNICYNAVDKHVKDGKGDKVAFFCEGNDPKKDQHTQVTYKELQEKVCQFANILKMNGVKKGDRVAIYLPMIVELPISLLACARIGAVHSVIFAGFSAESIASRVLDSSCKVIITSDGFYRGNKLVSLKNEVDRAVDHVDEENKGLVEKVLLVNRLYHYRNTSENIDNSKNPYIEKIVEGRDVFYHEQVRQVSDKCEVEWMDAEDPLFMLYTSGSTGKPKGVIHTTGGYMVYASTTFKYVFDYHQEDTYWCAADIGWITGHSYIVYGPLCNSATSVLFEGVPTFPDASRSWEIVDKYNVNQYYTAPTLIRALMKVGASYVEKTSRKSLRVLGSVGEPINPEAWLWYHNVIGNKNCSVVDTYWQTETGGIMITPLPGATPLKPGSATRPFFGIEPVILNDKGEILDSEDVTVEGFLTVKHPWPGQARTVYGDHERYEKTYFSMFKGYYVTGDGCKKDHSNGYYWLTGRIDDVLNVSGHRLGTAEIESAFVSHKSVSEAAVVPYPHDIKGQGIYCYITVKEGFEMTEDLKKELKHHVRKEIGAIATPDIIHWAPGLPKTRSGKIMRRILRKIAEGTESSLGDISTLADMSVVETLLQLRPKQ